jgi:hypothetical protein
MLKDENYYVVTGWMINKLHLSGGERDVFAIIYGFSQTVNCFEGSAQYLADFVQIRRNAVMRCLKRLTLKGFIVKEDVVRNNCKYCRYMVPAGISSVTAEDGIDSIIDSMIEKGVTEPLHKYALPAAASAQQKPAPAPSDESALDCLISRFIPGGSFSGKFLAGIISVCRSAGADPAGYAEYAARYCQTKKPSNLAAYFTAIALNSGLVSQYLREQNAEKKKEADNIIECPVCGCRHNYRLPECPECGIAAEDITDAAAVAEKKAIRSLSSEKQAAYNKDIEQLVALHIPLTRHAEFAARLDEINRKYFGCTVSA